MDTRALACVGLECVRGRLLCRPCGGTRLSSTPAGLETGAAFCLSRNIRFHLHTESAHLEAARRRRLASSGRIWLPEQFFLRWVERNFPEARCTEWKCPALRSEERRVG